MSNALLQAPLSLRGLGNPDSATCVVGMGGGLTQGIQINQRMSALHSLTWPIHEIDYLIAGQTLCNLASFQIRL
jgi:hypothetical protein